MPRDLLPFICRRLGLSTIQLGILDSLTLRLAVGQKLRKDQVPLLYGDAHAQDLEAVLSVFFEEAPDGYLTSEEATMLRKEMDGNRVLPDQALREENVNVADPQEEQKRLMRSQKAAKASKARWERARKLQQQAQENNPQASSKHSLEHTENARKDMLDPHKHSKHKLQEEQAILQAQIEQSSNASEQCSNAREHPEHKQASPKHSKHAKGQPESEISDDAHKIESIPSISSEHETMLASNAREESSKDEQAMLDAPEHSKHKLQEEQAILQASSKHPQALTQASRASTRTRTRASDPINLISDTDQIRSDQIGNQWFEILRARGFSEPQLRKAREKFEELIAKGLSVEQIEAVAERVIVNKPSDFAYAVKYLLASCSNELTAAKVGTAVAKKSSGGLVKVAPVSTPKKTLDEELAAMHRFLSRGANPFCLPDQEIPEVQQVLERARDDWLLAGKAIEGINPAGRPIRDPESAKAIKYYGVEDAKARIAKQSYKRQPESSGTLQ